MTVLDDPSTAKSADRVTIKNTTRSSLSVRVPGHSIYLGPGQCTEIPRHYLETGELKTLCCRGTVVKLPSAATNDAPEPVTERDKKRAEDPPAGKTGRANRSKER